MHPRLVYKCKQIGEWAVNSKRTSLLVSILSVTSNILYTKHDIHKKEIKTKSTITKNKKWNKIINKSYA